MEYKLIGQYDISVKKINNGFVVVVQNPDEVTSPQMFFADELEAYEFAALQISNVIEVLKNGKN